MMKMDDDGDDDVHPNRRLLFVARMRTANRTYLPSVPVPQNGT